MNCLAMDISKEEIVFFADETREHFSVPNSSKHLKRFFLQKRFQPSSTLVGCESTADYHLLVCKIALENKFEVKILNPILTKQIINASIRRKKTDYTDAQIIAKLLKEGNGTPFTLASLNQKKRTMLRTQHKIIDCASALKRVLKSLKQKSEVMDVSESLESIEKCIENLSSEAKALTEKAIEEKSDYQEQLLLSVPGCGEKLASIISAEAGDIRRFRGPSQFKAYVGIDPKISQSGNSLHHGRMTKSGNPHLRYALFLAANIARIHEPTLKAYYEKKRLEGKHHTHAVCTIVRKLCERIYAIVSKNCPYEVKKN